MPLVRIAIAVVMIAYGIVGSANLVLVGGVALVVWGAWGAAARRSRPRTASQAANKLSRR